MTPLLTLASSAGLLGITLAQQSGNAPASGPINREVFLVWAVVLIAVSIALFFIEVFVPSGGVLGVLSGISLIAGIVFLYRINTTLGLAGAAISIIAVPFLIAFAVRIWPETPFGRALILKAEDRGPDEIRESDDEVTHPPHDTPTAGVSVGAVGKAVGDLRPVGTCLIDGQRHECLAAYEMINHGSQIEVVAVDGLQIKVKLQDA